MQRPIRPHTLGIDDGPFDRHGDLETPVVGVMMEGPDLVEGVAVTRFAVDGDDATGFLAAWIEGLRLREALHAVLLEGVTIAGLGVVSIDALAERLGLPAIVVNRRRPVDGRIAEALRAAGLEERIPLVSAPDRYRRTSSGIHLDCAGIDRDHAEALVAATCAKSLVPEPLRLAHLMGAAIANGESRGRT